MKKITALCLALFLLYGCSPAPQPNSTQPNSTLPESAPALAPEDAPTPQQGAADFQGPDDFVMLRNTRETLGVADQAGHIFCQADENWDYWLIRTDPETQTSDYICRLEGCAHNTKSCAAFCPGTAGNPFAFEWDNTLFIMYSGDGVSPPWVEIASPDGTNRQPLWMYEGELEGVKVWQLALHKNHLYMGVMGSNTAKGTTLDYLARLDLRTSEYEVLQSFKEDLFIESAFNGELLLRTFETNLTPDENGDYQSMRDAYVVTLSYNPQTGECKELERYDNRQQHSLIHEGVVYTVHYDDFSVTKRPLGSNEEEVVCPGYTEAGTEAVYPCIELVMDGNIIVSDIRGYGVDPYTVYTLISGGQPKQWETCGSEGNFYVRPEYSFGNSYLVLTGFSEAWVPEYKLIDAEAFWRKDFSGEVLTSHIASRFAQNDAAL